MINNLYRIRAENENLLRSCGYKIVGGDPFGYSWLTLDVMKKVASWGDTSSSRSYLRFNNSRISGQGCIELPPILTPSFNRKQL